MIMTGCLDLGRIGSDALGLDPSLRVGGNSVLFPECGRLCFKDLKLLQDWPSAAGRQQPCSEAGSESSQKTWSQGIRL